ncbi:universal stress protein [Streptomyces sp. NPDC005931]|uniref:universal stress protein n=1 Tax=Streptomyces sp. NPDC005931 TaxID=3364737 RepID=UPI003699204A
MVQPVVAGVDGSDASLAAAEWAAHEAVRRNRPLRLLHAWEWHPRQGVDARAHAAQRHVARRVLRQAEERVRAVCPEARTCDEQIEGPAPAALVKAAEQAELLVLGSRGLGAFTGFLMGSVAAGVVARATGPVVLVRADDRAADRQLPPPTGDVVLGIDVAEACDEVIGFAFEEARLRGARLRAVHAWRAPGPLGLGSGEVGLVSEPAQGEEWLEFLSAVLAVWRDKYPEVDVLETVVADKPAGALVRAATGAGLLVVGHRLPARRVGPRTGPVTHAVIQHVGCPVAVVPYT